MIKENCSSLIPIVSKNDHQQLLIYCLFVVPIPINQRMMTAVEIYINFGVAELNPTVPPVKLT